MFRSRASERLNQKDSHWIKKTRFHLVADGFLSKEVSTQGLAGSLVSRILFDAIPEEKKSKVFHPETAPLVRLEERGNVFDC